MQYFSYGVVIHLAYLWISARGPFFQIDDKTGALIREGEVNI